MNALLHRVPQALLLLGERTSLRCLLPVCHDLHYYPQPARPALGQRVLLPAPSIVGHGCEQKQPDNAAAAAVTVAGASRD